MDRLAHFRFNHAPFLALAMSACASGVRPTLTFEVVFGRLAMGLSWERLVADCNVLEGESLVPSGKVQAGGLPFDSALPLE